MAAEATLVAGILAGLVLLVYVWALKATLRTQADRRVKQALNSAIRKRLSDRVAGSFAPGNLRLCPVRPFERSR